MWRSFIGLTRVGMQPRGFTLFSRRLLATQPKKQVTMKDLVKKYGWTVTGVYVGLSFIDLPLFYLLVHSAGQEKMEDAEIQVRKLLGANSERDNTYIHKAAAGGKSLFFAEFAIAYILHKLFIVVRVPLTIAITPSVATKLQQWGFRVNHALPIVDKAQLAQKISQKAAETNSSTVRQAAELVSSKKMSIDDAARIARKGSSQTANSVEDTTKKVLHDVASSAQQETAKNSERFGKPATKKNRWWWFF